MALRMVRTKLSVPGERGEVVMACSNGVVSNNFTPNADHTMDDDIGTD